MTLNDPAQPNIDRWCSGGYDDHNARQLAGASSTNNRLFGSHRMVVTVAVARKNVNFPSHTCSTE